MNSLHYVGLQLVLYGTAVGAIREYFYNSQQMNLTTAEIYCRENHGHLAHITTKEECQKALDVAPSLSWIGLKRTAPHLKIWQWSNGKITNFTKWGTTEPNDRDPGEDCVVMDRNGWRDTPCLGGSFTSICSRNFTLVKEKTTWEEALQHCRTQNADLVSEKLHEYYKILHIIQTRTDSVWTGLRFLDGKWFWLNQTIVPMNRLVSLPQCPMFPYHCGAYNFNSYIWENRDCNEKLHFVCYY